jgi:hypothetical protein
VWNSEETRVGAYNHSIINLTLSIPNVELNCSVAKEEKATGSDHEVFFFCLFITSCGNVSWGCQRHQQKKLHGGISAAGDSRGKTGRDREALKAKKAAAQKCYLRAVGETAVLDGSSTAEQTDAATAALREPMVGTLDEHAKKMR